jgi:hypothetical protein
MKYTSKSFQVNATSTSALNAYRTNFDKVFRAQPEDTSAQYDVERFRTKDTLTQHGTKYGERLTPEQAAFCERNERGTPCE